MKMNVPKAPWTAVAAATAFRPRFRPPMCKGKSGSCCYRSPRRFAHVHVSRVRWIRQSYGKPYPYNQAAPRAQSNPSGIKYEKSQPASDSHQKILRISAGTRPWNCYDTLSQCEKRLTMADSPLSIGNCRLTI